jgi:hypothetical protein
VTDGAQIIPFPGRGGTVVPIRPAALNARHYTCAGCRKVGFVAIGDPPDAVCGECGGETWVEDGDVVA